MFVSGQYEHFHLGLSTTDSLVTGMITISSISTIVKTIMIITFPCDAWLQAV